MENDFILESFLLRSFFTYRLIEGALLKKYYL